jgi:hypothetical protein
MKLIGMTILQAIRDPKLLGSGFKKKWLRNDTWQAWRSFLCACFGLPFENEAALETFRTCTQRVDAPTKQFNEAYLVCGRRSGKSYLTAAAAVYCAAFRDYSRFLAPGETAVCAIVAADKQQSQILLKYIRGFFQSSPVLRSMLVSDLREEISLKNGVSIQILTADYRSVRGRTLCAVLVDELAFLPASEGSANPAAALLEALRPGLISIPNSILLGLSSPYAKRGALYSIYKDNFGKNDSDVLVWQADSRTMNPSLSALAIAAAYLRDATSARSEYGAQFRDDFSGFLTQELIEGVVVRGRTSLPKQANTTYYAFCDPSGGRGDSMTLGISHLSDERAILDLLVERTSPCVPQHVTEEFCALLKQFGCTEVCGDRYSAEWCVAEFAKHGISYAHSERSRAQIYLEFLPSVTSGRVELLDNPRMISQFVGLERRTGRAADVVDHGVGQHDDICNSAAGCLVAALEGAGDYGVLDAHSSGLLDKWRNQFAAVQQFVTKDVWGRTEPSPRDDILDKAALFPIEARLRGVNVAKLNPQTAAAFELPPVGPCPVCKSKCTVVLSNQNHCNQCSHSWWAPGQAPEVIYATRGGYVARRLQ